MRKNLWFIIILSAIIFSGCEEKIVLNTSEIPSDYDSADELFYSKNYDKEGSIEELCVDIPELAVENQAIYYMGRGYLQRGDYQTDYRKREIVAYVIKDLNSESFYLLVQLYDRYLTYYLGDFFDADSQGMVACADVDGDGNDEIVLSMEINGNRNTLAHIYKIQNDAIELMYDLDGEENSPSNYGYTYEFLGDRKIKIANQYTGDEWIKDISGHYEFDEAGKPLYGGIFFTSYASRVFPDIAYDGRVTLRYYQYVRVQGSDFLGYTITTLKYKYETKAFDVVETEFVEDQYMYNWQ